MSDHINLHAAMSPYHHGNTVLPDNVNVDPQNMSGGESKPKSSKRSVRHMNPVALAKKRENDRNAQRNIRDKARLEKAEMAKKIHDLENVIAEKNEIILELEEALRAVGIYPEQGLSLRAPEMDQYASGSNGQSQQQLHQNMQPVYTVGPQTQTIGPQPMGPPQAQIMGTPQAQSMGPQHMGTRHMGPQHLVQQPQYTAFASLQHGSESYNGSSQLMNPPGALTYSRQEPISPITPTYRFERQRSIQDMVSTPQMGVSQKTQMPTPMGTTQKMGDHFNAAFPQYRPMDPMVFQTMTNTQPITNLQSMVSMQPHPEVKPLNPAYQSSQQFEAFMDNIIFSEPHSETQLLKDEADFPFNQGTDQF